MKTYSLALALAVAAGLWVPTGHAYGTTMISNLGVPWSDPGTIGDIEAIYPEQGFGVAFITGANPSQLDSVTLEHIDYVGPVQTFQVRVFQLGPRYYDENYGVRIYPVTWVGDLVNPVVDPRPTQWPGTTTYVDYTPSATISLEPNTPYLLAATDDVQNQTGLLFAPANNYTAMGDWSIGHYPYYPQLINYGFGWVVRFGVYDLKVEINASFVGQDTTAPTITCPEDFTVPATTTAGAEVSFSPTVSDNVDPNPTVGCSPASGSTFPIGTTTVNCTATDASGNSASCSFTVTVKGAPEQVVDLVAVVQSLSLKHGLETSLLAKLQATSASLNRGDVASACGTLTAFIQEVAAQSGKKWLTVDEAELLIQEAMRIRTVLGC